MVDLVLIDDDVLIHGTWTMVARMKKHHLVCVRTIDEFLEKSFPQNTPVYLDYHFHSGDNGIELAKKLYQKGYKNLYITTGSSQVITDKPEEIISILSKDYPL
jgi:FixJ family two-component response regulator